MKNLIYCHSFCPLIAGILGHISDIFCSLHACILSQPRNIAANTFKEQETELKLKVTSLHFCTKSLKIAGSWVAGHSNFAPTVHSSVALESQKGSGWKGPLQVPGPTPCSSKAI